VGAAGARRVISDRLGYGLVVYGIFVVIMTGTLPTGLLQDYAEVFGFSPAVLSFVAASTTFGVTIAVIGFGNLSDRSGRRPVLIAGVTAGALCLVLYFVIQGAALFVAGRVLSGFAVGLSRERGRRF
jgi:MFS family permease